MKIIKINIDVVVADDADVRDIVNNLAAGAVTLDGVKYAEAHTDLHGEDEQKPATEEAPAKPKRKYTRHVHLEKVDGAPATPVVTEVRT